MRSPKDEIEKLRREGDPRATEAAKKLIREITRCPDLARELAAQAIHFRSDLYFGDPQNATGAIGEHAGTLGVSVVIVAPPS